MAFERLEQAPGSPELASWRPKPASVRPLARGGTDGRTDGRMDIRMYRFPLSSTGLRPPLGLKPKKPDNIRQLSWMTQYMRGKITKNLLFSFFLRSPSLIPIPKPIFFFQSYLFQIDFWRKKKKRERERKKRNVFPMNHTMVQMIKSWQLYHSWLYHDCRSAVLYFSPLCWAWASKGSMRWWA